MLLHLPGRPVPVNMNKVDLAAKSVPPAAISGEDAMIDVYYLLHSFVRMNKNN